MTGPARGWRERARSIPRIDAPSAAGFERDYRRPSRPAIFRGEGPDAALSIASLRDAWRGAQVPTVPIDARGFARYSRTHGVPYARRDARALLDAHARGEAREYAVFPIEKGAPALPALATPLYGAHADWKRSRFWLAPPDARGALHFDLPDNLHVQLRGTKEWVLFPWWDALRLGPQPPWSGVPNYARADPLGEPATEIRGAEIWHAILAPGETLYVPRCWWHQARSIETSVGVNYWWAEGAMLGVVRAAEVVARARRLRL